MTVMTEPKQILKRKMLGVLMRSVRNRAGLNVQETAALLGLPPETLLACEEGRQEAGLPVLEGLARLANLPVSYFWSETPFPSPEEHAATPRAVAIRRKMVGIRLRQAREEAGRTPQQVAEFLGCPVEEVTRCEAGQADIPFSRLEALTGLLNVELNYFLNGAKEPSAPPEEVAVPEAAAPATPPAPPPPSPAEGAPPAAGLEHLPPDIQAFLQDPTNILYIKLAMRLHNLSADTLRTLAEGILDITY
ncbi:MAG: transcriptional regulator [Caldilineae bacterium]|nr:MAG: transcriptional regulator [Caldilineae bacterium]